MTEAELSAALEKAETERDELVTQVAKLEKKLKKADKADKAEPAEIDKSELPQAVREALEKAEKRAEEADARMTKAEEVAKAEHDERVTREFIAKAQDDFPRVGAAAAEFGPVLKRASELLSKEDYDLLLQRFSAADAQLEANDVILKQVGHANDGERNGNSDLARKADEIQKADSNVSDYEAMRQAAKGADGARYLQEVR